MRARSIETTAFLLLAGLFLTPAAQAIDVDLVAITAGANREDGVLMDYFLSFSLEGSDLADVRVFRPGNPPIPVCLLVDEGDGAWNCDLPGFTSLNDICVNVGFGDFLFELTAAVGSDDTLTVFFDPGCTDPFSGFPAITAPTSGGTVSTEPGPADFCWTCSAPGACGNGDTAASLFNDDSDLAVELLRGVALPACWDPGVCLPPGPDNEFEVSALEVYADFETAFTDLGDDLIYLSAYESQNRTPFTVSGAVPTSPPAVPAGTGSSQATQVAKLDAGGNTLELIWDIESCCGIGDHHLVHGSGSDLPGSLGAPFSVGGSVCTLGAGDSFTWSGVPAPAAGEFLWWIILGSDGAGTEGSWGEDSAGNERLGPGLGGVSGACGMSLRDVSNACGR